MKSFFELTHEQRFAAYDAIRAIGCDTRIGSGGSGLLSVAIAKGKFSELNHALVNLGLEFVNLYKFSLGTDKPPMHLRHESHGQPDCCWLIANYRPL